jgi:uncharacterized membrane protein YeaQ/YmgE (transglycosylase-associated protein family)
LTCRFNDKIKPLEENMGILSWIIVGGLAGWVASIIMGRNERQGCLMNIVVGVVGAFIGGFIVSFFGQDGVTGFNFWSFLVATGGAVALLAVVNLITKKR